MQVPQRPAKQSRQRPAPSNPRSEGYKPEGGIPEYLSSRGRVEQWGPSGLTILTGGGLFLGGYLFGESVLAARPHPVHWLAAVIGAAIGSLAGWLAGRLLRR